MCIYKIRPDGRDENLQAIITGEATVFNYRLGGLSPLRPDYDGGARRSNFNRTAAANMIHCRRRGSALKN